MSIQTIIGARKKTLIVNQESSKYYALLCALLDVVCEVASTGFHVYSRTRAYPTTNLERYMHNIITNAHGWDHQRHNSDICDFRRNYNKTYIDSIYISHRTKKIKQERTKSLPLYDLNSDLRHVNFFPSVFTDNTVRNYSTKVDFIAKDTLHCIGCNLSKIHQCRYIQW